MTRTGERQKKKGINQPMGLTSEAVIHFAHANGFPAGSYQALFNALPAHWQNISLPMFGHSPRFPVVDNWRHQVDELIEHVIQHAQGKPVYAIGHSFGGVVSFMAACEAPEHFAGLIMLDPPLVAGASRYVFQLAKKTPLIDRLTPAKLTRVRRRQWPVETNLVEYFSQRALFKDMDKRCVRDYVNAVTKMHNGHWQLTFEPEVETALFRHIPHNLHQYRGRLQCPALLMTGSGSRVCAPNRYKPFIRYNPHIAHTTFHGGHMFPLERPEALAERLVEIISRWQDKP